MARSETGGAVSATGGPGPERGLWGVQYKHLMAAEFVLAMFMDIMDVTVVNVSLPVMGRDFHAGYGSLEWVVTAYLLSLAAWIPASGWIGDRFGTKKTLLFALAVFTAGSALCGLSPGLGWLVGFRVLQGVGGGMRQAVGAFHDAFAVSLVIAAIGVGLSLLVNDEDAAPTMQEGQTANSRRD
jgi:MFS family permease